MKTCAIQRLLELKDYTKASEAFAEEAKNPDAQTCDGRSWPPNSAKANSLKLRIFVGVRLPDSEGPPSEEKNAWKHLQLLTASKHCKQTDC